jgi:hypothetical protein
VRPARMKPRKMNSSSKLENTLPATPHGSIPIHGVSSEPTRWWPRWRWPHPAHRNPGRYGRAIVEWAPRASRSTGSATARRRPRPAAWNTAADVGEISHEPRVARLAEPRHSMHQHPMLRPQASTTHVSTIARWRIESSFPRSYANRP